MARNDLPGRAPEDATPLVRNDWTGGGHCDPIERSEPFDLRPPHQLTPATRTVIVTESIKRLFDARSKEPFTVTVVAVVPGDASNDVLEFQRVRLLSYA